MNVQHSSKSVEWYTPADIVESARAILGGIDLDPASCLEANQTVRARFLFTKEHDGLRCFWGPRPVGQGPSVFVNPPGGTTKACGEGRPESLAGAFWRKLMLERAYIKDAIFVCFSIEALQNTQGKPVYSTCEFPICIPRKRVKFNAPGGVTPKSPSHANAVIYVPGQIDRSKDFAAEFAKHGAILRPW